MNDENLIPFDKRSESERRAMAQAGGRASGRARRIKSRGRQLIQDLLALKCQDKNIIDALCREYGVNPDDLSNEVAMTLRQMQKATRKGDTYAYNSVLKAAGIADEEPAPATSVGLQINVGTAEAAEGLRVALQNGAQPAKPTDKESKD